MIKRVIGIIISISIAFPAYGFKCEKPVTKLAEGDPSPCEGYLFSPEKEAELYRINEQNKLYVDLVPKLEEKNDILNKRLQLYREYSVDLEDRLHSKQLESDVMKVVYFLSGALLMYGTYKVVDANN